MLCLLLRCRGIPLTAEDLQAVLWLLAVGLTSSLAKSPIHQTLGYGQNLIFHIELNSLFKYTVL